MKIAAPRLVGGWYLPGKDSYFDRYVEGTGQKQNGFQREHLDAALEHVKRWSVAIDVGAHVGFWTHDMATRFKEVYAFEPANDTFSCLVKNMVEHANVVCTNAAVGDKSGSVVLNDRSGHEGNTGGRYVKRVSDGHTPMIALDDLKFTACDFLKVDVEGFESYVLRGAKRLIEKHWPVISMETDKKFAFARYGVSNAEAEHFLLKRGYQVVYHDRPDKVFVRNV